MGALAIAIGRFAVSHPVLQALRTRRVEILHATSGAEALAALASTDPDLLIVGTGVSDSIACLRSARAAGCRAPILLCGPPASSDDLVDLGVVLVAGEAAAPAERRIVLLSRDPALRAFVRLALRGLFDVHCAADVRRALERAQEQEAADVLVEESALGPGETAALVDAAGQSSRIILIRPRAATPAGVPVPAGRRALHRPFTILELREALS